MLLNFFFNFQIINQIFSHLIKSNFITSLLTCKMFTFFWSSTLLFLIRKKTKTKLEKNKPNVGKSSQNARMCYSSTAEAQASETSKLARHHQGSISKPVTTISFRRPHPYKCTQKVHTCSVIAVVTEFSTPPTCPPYIPPASCHKPSPRTIYRSSLRKSTNFIDNNSFPFSDAFEVPRSPPNILSGLFFHQLKNRHHHPPLFIDIGEINVQLV